MSARARGFLARPHRLGCLPGAAAIAVFTAGIGPTVSAQPAIGIDVRARSLQPGELVVVALDAPAEAIDVRVTAFNRTAAAFRGDDGWKALIGIDLDQRPGPATVSARARVGASVLAGERRLTILAKKFETRSLKVSPDFVNPPPEQQKRIASESALLQRTYESSSADALWRGPFVRPVSEAANSRFGSRSIFNGEPRSPHAGTDFLSPAGTPVKAPNGGRVRIARDLFFSGQTVVIDHGLGVFSTLAHLSVIAVKEGQTVGAGDIVGNVGATGRVTGPHLHWALRVGGARVDALSIVALLGAP
jgi:murein DD-endopeptidase MepM/ murein hydrolase activator NlpD